MAGAEDDSPIELDHHLNHSDDPLASNRLYVKFAPFTLERRDFAQNPRKWLASHELRHCQCARAVYQLRLVVPRENPC